MQLTILADENIPAVAHYLGAQAKVLPIDGRKLTASQLAGVDALLIRSVSRVDSRLLSGSQVRFVGSATSGFDHVDREYLRAQGIEFAYAPGSNANSVVEYVLAAVAACDDKLEQLLAGGTVGIVGYGVIGRALAARLQVLGIAYCSYDPWLPTEQISRPAELAEVLQCDVITLHAELTRQQPWPSYHLLSERELAVINPDALLINASRGAVVDNAALLRLLQTGGGPKTVLDVWEGEPAIDSELLRQVTLGTAHIAGYSLDGKILATRMLCDAMRRVFDLARPAGGSPIRDPGRLRLAGGLSGAALVRQLLQQRYDIGRDDSELRRAVIDAPPAEAAQGFDNLRRNYPERRELAASRVVASLSSDREIELVRALGCEPVPPGTQV